MLSFYYGKGSRATPDLRDPTTRIGRALLPLDEHADEIERVGPSTYLDPSCSEEGVFWRVHYSHDREYCNCPDFEYHGDEEPCKHVYAVAILRARRRRGRS